MYITSSAFGSLESIPTEYTCDGENISVPVSFSDVPKEAKSLALIVHDPDVPVAFRPDGNWDHWLVWNMKPDTKGLVAGCEPDGIVGRGTGGKNGYEGPCPPDKQHRYFFTLYALDRELAIGSNSDKSTLLAAMNGHILEQAELMGVYERK